jgi:hypothetical protein
MQTLPVEVLFNRVATGLPRRHGTAGEMMNFSTIGVTPDS